MGIILGRIFHKRGTTLEALEQIETEIKDIENYRRDTEQYQKKVVGRFVILSVFIYLFTAFLFYFYFFSASLKERLFYIIPLILAPVIIISVKRILSWYYNRKLKVKQTRLRSLKEEKQKLLEKVMETETYKNAKVILEKFAPEQTLRKSIVLPSTELTPHKPLTSTYSSTGVSSGLRQRTFQQTSQSSRLSLPMTLTPVPSRTPYQGALRNTPAASLTNITTSPLPLPRAILPRERSILDKMVDYLVGDGPSNRYALICEECNSHNGMAVREEFDYISFRCCYCFHMNPARKKKPAAPQLNMPRIRQYSSSDDPQTESESEVEEKKQSEKRASVTNTLYESKLGEFETMTEKSEDSGRLDEDSLPGTGSTARIVLDEEARVLEEIPEVKSKEEVVSEHEIGKEASED